MTRGTSRRHHPQKTTKIVKKTARTVEVDGEHGEPDDVPDEERGGADEQRRLAEHLAAHADEEDAPRDGLEHEQSGVLVAGRGAHSGGGGAVDDQEPEQELIFRGPGLHMRGGWGGGGAIKWRLLQAGRELARTCVLCCSGEKCVYVCGCSGEVCSRLLGPAFSPTLGATNGVPDAFQEQATFAGIQYVPGRLRRRC